MTDLRPTFDLRTGAGLTRWRIERVIGLSAALVWVPAHLAAMTAERLTAAVNQLPDADADEEWLLINGRFTGARERGMLTALRPNEALVDAAAGGDLAAARVKSAMAREILSRGFMLPFPAEKLRVIELPRPCLISRPWHILDQLEDALDADAALIDLPTWRGREKEVFVKGEFPIKVARDATLHAGVYIDASRGPVYIGNGAVVHSLTTIEGPCYIGSETVVAPHTAIRSGSIIGPVCKVAGEISFSIIHGYSNKAHAGFLGHSLVGQWVNLGADTQVSNLKNTYGNVRMQLQADLPAEDSGRTFLGPLIGDFVRTAIGSRLPTGSCIHTGAMVALSSFAPKLVRRFGFLTDDSAESTDPARFIETAKKMMARRHIEMSHAEEHRLRMLLAE